MSTEHGLKASFLYLRTENRDASTTSCKDDRAFYASIDAEVYGEAVHYSGLDFVIQVCLEAYLDDRSFWFLDQRQEVLVVVRLGVRTNPLILKVVYPNLKIVFLPNTAKLFSPLQLGATFQFHTCYRIIVMHLPEQNAHCFADR